LVAFLRIFPELEHIQLELNLKISPLFGIDFWSLLPLIKKALFFFEIDFQLNPGWETAVN
jgi:hypothetical protein